MKQKIFTKVSISIVIATAFAISVYTIACVTSYNPDSIYVSLFDKTLSDAPNTRPFYYSYLSLFDENPFEADNKTNLAEWKAYTTGFAKEADINTVVYKMEVKQLDDIKNSLLSDKNPLIEDSLKNNSFLQYLIIKKDIPCISYLIYAKNCEPLVSVTYDDMWDYKPVQEKDTDSLQNIGLKAYKQNQNQFLKLRYAFQVQRLAQYTQMSDNCIEIYDSLVKPLTVKSDVKYWCMSLKAGALQKNGQQALAAYLFSKVFDQCPKYRLQAYTSFTWLRELNIDSALSFCANNHEKAVFYSMMAYNSELPDTLYINKVYQLEPKSLDLEVLLIREINKIEYQLQSIYESDTDKANDMLYTADVINAALLLKQRITHIADAGNTANPALWNMALAYINYLQKDAATADTYMAKIDTKALNSKLSIQYNVLKVLVEIIRTDRITPATETAIFPYILKLRQAFNYDRKAKNNDENDTGFKKDIEFADRAYATLMTEILSRTYSHQGDKVKALVCMSVGEFDASYYPYAYYSGDFLYSTTFRLMDKHTNNDDLKAILQFISFPRSNEFDQYISKHSGIDKASLIELIGTKYIRSSDFGNAVSVLMMNPENRKDDIGDYIDCNPFGDSISETHKRTTADTVKYSKLKFARRMSELENLLKSDPANAASYYYQLANGYYNISYYGNSWAIVHYDRSTSETYEMDKHTVTNDYYTAKKALSYFIKAINSSKNKEFKAKCTMLAAKCYQAHTLSQDSYWSGKPLKQEEYMMNNPYFESLFKEYRKTAFYKTAIVHCTYLKDFVEDYRKK